MLKQIKKTIKALSTTLSQRVIIKGGNASKAAIFNDINVSNVKNILNNQDFAQTMKLYRTMLKRDWQINGDLQERQIEITGAKYKIEAKDKALVVFFEEYLKSINLSSLLADINSGIEYGYALVDLQWESTSLNGTTYFLPTNFNFIKQVFLQLDAKKGLYVQDEKMQKHYLEELNYKFLFHSHKMAAGDILDYSVLSKLIWIFTIKHFIVAQSMSYSELLGVPPIIVNSNSNDKNTIMQMMDQVLELRSGSAGVFGKDDKVSLVEGKASSDMFLNFIKYCDAAISHIILGGSMSSGSSSSGSYARDTTHNSIKDSYHEADMRLISQTITDLFKKICDLNFNNVIEYPTFSLIYEPSTGTNNTNAQKEQNTKTVENNFSFREFNAKKPLSQVDVQLNKLDTSGIEEQMLSEIENILQSADSYQEALSILSQSYETLEFEKLENLMENYIFNATVSGDLNG